MLVSFRPALPSRAALVAALGVLGGLALSLAARAETVDCDKLAHSTTPYEVTMKAGEAELKYQVQRTDKGLTTLLIRNLDGSITKLENQSTFPKTMTMPNGQKATFEYSVPTDKPLYTQAVKSLHMKLVHDLDVLIDTPVTLEYLPDEKITLGACTFNTKHYVQISTTGGRGSRNEIWYAPDLEFGLKSLSTMKAGDQKISKQAQATSLTTEFKPFK